MTNTDTAPTAADYVIMAVPARDILPGDRLVVSGFAGPAINRVSTTREAFSGEHTTVYTVNGGELKSPPAHVLEIARPIDAEILTLGRTWAASSITL